LTGVVDLLTEVFVLIDGDVDHTRGVVDRFGDVHVLIGKVVDRDAGIDDLLGEVADYDAGVMDSSAFSRMTLRGSRRPFA
jgi:hypothetical protein